MSALRLATRRSPLALAQAAWTAAALRAARPGLAVELLPLESEGDRRLEGPLHEAGGKGLFVKEIQQALLDGRADLAVHSAKDYPHDNPSALVAAAFPAREWAGDLLLSPGAGGLAALPAGARVGSASLRRRGQLLARRPDLSVELLRGNVGTRLRRLHAGEFAAILLAEAGLRRLGLAEALALAAPLPFMIPAAGQGALLIEARADDARARGLAAALDDARTRAEVECERAFVAGLGGNCATPIAARATLAADGATLDFTGLLVAPDGRAEARVTRVGASADPRTGREAARELRADPRAAGLLPGA